MSIDATTFVRPAPDGVSYASWVRRLAALAIDAVLLSIVPFLLVVVGYIQGVREGEENLYAMLDWFIFGMIIAVAFGIISSAFYFTLLVGRNGQTVGKKVVGVAVRDSRDATQRIGYWRALARFVITSILWSVYYVPGIIDCLWPLWDKRAQTWHDKVSRSVVVRV
jgi:uncharacterized RDD family membrane protein YckC